MYRYKKKRVTPTIKEKKGGLNRGRRRVGVGKEVGGKNDETRDVRERERERRWAESLSPNN